MKRSEVIKKIASCMSAAAVRGDYENWARTALEMCENSGMLPPIKSTNGLDIDTTRPIEQESKGPIKWTCTGKFQWDEED